MRDAFTLIELLVVITIIVLLLSLLTPALDKAIYQAELASCGAQLKGVGSGVLTYAVENKRHYPHRGVVDNTLTTPMSLAKGGVDDRRVLRQAFDLKTMNCPLTGEIDLEYPNNATWIYASYHLYFSFQYKDDRKMKRIGNKWTYTEGSPSVSEQFEILAGDMDVRNVDNQSQFGSHPDSAGVLQNVTINKPAQDQVSPGVPGAQNEVFRRWQTTTTTDRGLLDLNYLYDDGSVRRLSDVPESTDPPASDDLRTPVATWNNKSNPQQKNYVPRR